VKIFTLGTEFSMRSEGQTDLKNLMVAFRNFANAPTTQCSQSSA